MAQRWMTCDLISDNDEPKVLKTGEIPYLPGAYGEAHHQSADVLLRIGAPDVEQERIMDTVAIQNALDVGRISGLMRASVRKRGSAGLAEDRIGGIVNDADAVGW